MPLETGRIGKAGAGTRAAKLGVGMETLGLAIGLAVAAMAIPITAIAVHQSRRRRYEKKAGVRKKEKIVL